MYRRTFLATAALVPVVGCTGGNGDGGTPSPTATPVETLTATPMETVTATPSRTPTKTATPTQTETATDAQRAQEAYPDFSWGKLEDATPSPTTTIEMSGFRFDPLIAVVAPNTDLTVVNRDSVSHTFTVPRLGIDETLAGEGRYTMTLEEAGTFDYVCTFHPPEMLGRIVVTENPPTASPTPTSTPTATPTPTPTGGDGGGGGYDLE